MKFFCPNDEGWVVKMTAQVWGRMDWVLIIGYL